MTRRPEPWRSARDLRIPEAVQVAAEHGRLAEIAKLPTHVDSGGHLRVTTADVLKVVDTQPSSDDEGARDGA